MRGSIAPEPEDFCIFICLNAALLGPPKPNSVLQSLVSICCTLFLCTFSNFPGGTIPPYKNRGGDVSPRPPRDRRPCTDVFGSAELTGESTVGFNDYYRVIFILFWKVIPLAANRAMPQTGDSTLGLYVIRWSVNDRSPIVFVRIFFLYLFIYLLFIIIYFYLLFPLFCLQDNSRSV